MKKKMRVIAIAVAITMVFAVAPMSVSALTPNDTVLDEIKASVIVGGATHVIPEKYIQLATDYLKYNTLTPEQASSAVASIRDAKATWQTFGKPFSTLTPEQKGQLTAKAVTTAKAMGADLTYDLNTGVVTVVDPKGRKFEGGLGPNQNVEVNIKSNLSGAVITGAANATFTNKQIKPAVTVTINDITLDAGADYTISYGANKAIGQGTVTVTGVAANLFEGSKTFTFKINPKAIKVRTFEVGRKSIQVIWTKADTKQKLSKLTVQYRVKGTKTWKNSAKISPKKASYTIKKLKVGKRYQVRIVAAKGSYTTTGPMKASKKKVMKLK